MNKKIQLALLIVFILVLILTYSYITRGKPISSVREISICKFEQKLILHSNHSAQFISKVEQGIKNDTLYLKVFTKTVSFFQSQDEFQYEIILTPEINIIQMSDSAFECNKIGKCIE